MYTKIATYFAFGSLIIPASSFDGIQLGGQIGINVLKGHHHYLRRPVPGGTAIADQRERISDISYLAGLQGGYIGELGTSKTLIGGEIYLLLPGGKPKKILLNLAGGSEGEYGLQHKNSLGLAFIIGMILNPKVAVYGRLGFEMAKFEATYQGLTTGSPTRFSSTKRSNGFVPGLGATYKFSNHFLIGLELTVPFFKKIFYQSDNEVVNGRRMMLSYKPLEYRLGLKLMYRF